MKARESSAAWVRLGGSVSIRQTLRHVSGWQVDGKCRGERLQSRRFAGASCQGERECRWRGVGRGACAKPRAFERHAHLAGCADDRLDRSAHHRIGCSILRCARRIGALFGRSATQVGIPRVRLGREKSSPPKRGGLQIDRELPEQAAIAQKRHEVGALPVPARSPSRPRV